MTSSLAVDVAREADLEAIVDVFVSVAAEGRWILTELPIDRAQRRDAMLATIRRPDALMLVARRAGAVAGQLVLQPQARGLLGLGMCVGAAWRSHGLGSALLARSIEWARGVRAHKISLEVFPHNTAAIALYEKHGFVPEGLFRRQVARKNGELWDVMPMGLLL